MKYLFLLLVLTACTAPKAEAEKQKLAAVRAEAEKQKAEAIRADAMASADKVLREMNDKDAADAAATATIAALIAAYKRTNTAPDPKVLITNHLNQLEWVNPLDYTNAAEEIPNLLDVIPFIYLYDHELYVLYRHDDPDDTPFTNEYNMFFSNQLVKYGRDIQGRRIINREAHYIFERDVLNYE